MRKALLLALFVVVGGSLAVHGQGSGQFAGVSQCWNGREFVTVKGNCPTPNGNNANSGSRSSSSSSAANSAVNSAIYSGAYSVGYQLGSAFGRWLFGSTSNPQAELQKRQMMAELQRRQAEAERQHREEEARQLAAMYNRLAAHLKLSGLPNLQMKDTPGSGSGLHLKLGDAADGQVGIKGLPGMYLNDGKVPYGIPGLPGIYTGGAGGGSGLTNSKLALKAGEPEANPAQAANSAPVLTNESALQPKIGEPGAETAAQTPVFDPSKMTPSQLADVAEFISKLPPDEQQRLMNAAQTNAAGEQQPPGMIGHPSDQALTPLQQLELASRSAASAPVLEDASGQARLGFDTGSKSVSSPINPQPTSTTPKLLRVPDTVQAEGAAPGNPIVEYEGIDADAGRPYEHSPATRRFHIDPNPPLLNPLREQEKLQAELKKWDDWAMTRAANIAARLPEPSFPLVTALGTVNASALERYAPELLARYNSDAAFRESVDVRLRYTNERAALVYYQAQAEAHKAAILSFQSELEKLVVAGKLEKLVPLEDQYRLHPERRQFVRSVWDRITVDEQISLAKAEPEARAALDYEYRLAFQLVRRDAAGGTSQ